MNTLKDWIACFELIHKIIRIEETRGDDKNDKIIAVGSEQDVSYALKFIETDSELLHLSLLCDDAEFYPDLQDTLRKTPAIEKRSRQLNRIWMRKGLDPIFMEMDEKRNSLLRMQCYVTWQKSPTLTIRWKVIARFPTTLRWLNICKTTNY